MSEFAQIPIWRMWYRYTLCWGRGLILVGVIPTLLHISIINLGTKYMYWDISWFELYIYHSFLINILKFWILYLFRMAEPPSSTLQTFPKFTELNDLVNEKVTIFQSVNYMVICFWICKMSCSKSIVLSRYSSNLKKEKLFFGKVKNYFWYNKVSIWYELFAPGWRQYSIFHRWLVCSGRKHAQGTCI